MKKNNSLALIAVLITATIISSCSSEKGLTVEKRKYRKGYSFAWNNGKNETQQKSNVTKQSNTTDEHLTELKTIDAPVEIETTNAMPALVASSEKSSSAISTSVTDLKTDDANSTETVKSDNFSESKNESPTVAKKYTKADRKEMRQFLRHKAPGNTDIPLWAYILFAIILPPLAVGLFEGIHGPFWLSILLTLCFWLPGVIYAIWRVTK